MEIETPPGFTCRYQETIGSTSDDLKALAADGAPDGTALAAGEQTAGRGRYGRGWDSPPGNLYMSVLLRDVGPLHQAAQLSFVAAVALGEAIAELTPGDLAVRFKWPNDVLANGRKVAGLLLESGGSDWRARWRVQGFAPVRAAWLAAAAHRGQAITLRLSDREPRPGRFVDLDGDGALLFEPAGGGPAERISAGEVHFPLGT